MYKRLKDYEGNGKGLFTGLISIKKNVDSEMKELAVSRGDTLNGPVVKEMATKSKCDYRNFKLNCGHNVDLKIVHYRSGAYRCSVCFNNELYDLAKEKGLELLSTEMVGTKGREYKRACGHTIILSHQRIKDKYELSCTECCKQELEHAAEVNGFIFKHLGLNSYKITFNKCGHTAVRSRKSIKREEVGCPTCRQESFKVEASAVNMTLLDNIKSGASRLYSCNFCGNKEVFSLGSIRKKNVRCDKCYLSSKVNDATKAGLVFNGNPSNNKIGFHSYVLPCGCTKDLRFYDVRLGNWLCHTHQETYYNHPNNLYVFEITSNNFSWLKIGYSKNLETRVNGYGVSEGFTHDLLFNKEFETTYKVMQFEKSFHKLFKKYKLDKTLMKQYMNLTGHTECYPVGKKYELLEYLNKELNGNQKENN